MDDPVNANDPAGLLPFLLPFAAGMAGATAISATGSYLAARATDWFGKKTDKDYGKDKPTATEGVHDAMGKAIGINSGIVSAAGAAKAAPAVLKATPSLIRQGRDGVKAAAGEAGKRVKAGLDWAKNNPDKVDKVGRVGKDLVDPNLPPETPEGQLLTAGRFLAQKVKEQYANRHDTITEEQKKNKHIPSGVWGR